MIETINALIILCSLFVIIFMIAKREKKDSDQRRKTMEFALGISSDAFFHKKHILSGFPLPVTDKFKGVNMSDFKIGNWVEHYRYGVCRIFKVAFNCNYKKYELEIIKSFDYMLHGLSSVPTALVLDSEVTKLYPKFDKFDDLFSEQPLKQPKFKLGDKVISSLTEDEVLTITKIIGDIENDFFYYVEGKSKGGVSEELLTKYVEKEKLRFEVGDKVTCSFLNKEDIYIVSVIDHINLKYRIECETKIDRWCTDDLWCIDEYLTKYVEKEPKFKVGDKVTSSLDNKEKVYTILKIDRNDIDNTGYYIDGEFSHWVSGKNLTKYVEKKQKFKIGERVVFHFTTYRQIATIISVFFDGKKPNYELDCIHGFIQEKRLSRLNDPEILRVGDKVKYIGKGGLFGNADYLKQNSVLIILEKNKNRVLCLYESTCVRAKFNVDLEVLELILD